MLKGNKVWTPNGYQSGPVNSLVGKGESIIDYTNGTGTLVTKGKVGVDNQPSSVSVNDNNVIAGNDIDWSNGMKFSDQVAPLTAKLQMYNNIEKRAGKKSELSSLSKQTMELQKNQLDRAKAPILQAMKNITDRQERQHQIEDYAAQIKHNCGKDRFDSGKSFWKSYTTGGKGKVSNLMLDAGYALPALLETQMLNHWRKENPVMPNIYAANRYAPIALQTMAGNRVSANPILEKLYAQDRQAAYQLANSGGYTGGQRQANRVALALGNQRNVADALMNVQEKNAAYRNAYAEMAARLGDSDAQRLQQSNQYGWEAYNRAHGAKTKGIETHLSNLGLIGQKWLSQRIKNKQYGDILDMYQQDIDNKKEALKTIYGIGTDGLKSAVASGSTNKVNSTSGSPSINYRNIAPGWTPSQYSPFIGSPNIISQNTEYDPILNTGKQVVYSHIPASIPFQSTGNTIMHHNDFVPDDSRQLTDEQRARFNSIVLHPGEQRYLRSYKYGMQDVIQNPLWFLYGSTPNDRLPGFYMNKRNRTNFYTGI